MMKINGIIGAGKSLRKEQRTMMIGMSTNQMILTTAATRPHTLVKRQEGVMYAGDQLKQAKGNLMSSATIQDAEAKNYLRDTFGYKIA